MSDINLEELNVVTEAIDGDLFHLRRPSATGDQDKAIEKNNLVTRTVTNIVLDEAVISIGQIVCIKSNGHGELADITDTDKITLAGVATETGAISATIKCQKVGELIATAHGYTIGRQYYLGSTGSPVLKENIPSGVPSIPLFAVIDANTLDLSVGQLEIESNDYNQMVIGDIIYSHNPADRAGFLRVDFNNAVAQSAYHDLYAIVGDQFETEHTNAGDSASGAGNFYPTSIPGFYSRSALSLDIAITSVDDSTERITIPVADYNRLNSLRGSGLPIKLTVVSGTLTGGLTEETKYFIGFISSGIISLYNTEDDAINDTSPIDLTDTNTGTYTFHQTGITLDFSLEDHNHKLQTGGGSGSAKRLDTVATYSGTTDYGLDTLSAEDANVSNETRPKTIMQYAFIKAVDIDLTSGQSVTALKYDSGFSEITNWLNRRDTYTHNLNDNLSSLLVKIFLSSDGTEANAIEVTNITFSSSALNTEYNFQIEYNDANSIIIATGANGARYYDSSGDSVTLGSSQSYYLKVVIYKPQFTTKVYEPKNFYYDLTSSSATHNLPDATTYIGEITLRCSNGTFGTNNLTVETVGSQTIDGYSNYVIELENKVTFESDGTNWFIKNIYQPLKMHVQHQESAGTGGGNASNASPWIIRTLNTEVTNTIPGTSLSSNQITLPAGTYDIDIWGNFFKCGFCKDRFRNVTDGDGSHDIICSTELTDSANNVSITSKGSKRITLSASKTFELQYYVTITRTTNGLGVGYVTFGEIEVHANIEITKVA